MEEQNSVYQYPDCDEMPQSYATAVLQATEMHNEDMNNQICHNDNVTNNLVEDSSQNSDNINNIKVENMSNAMSNTESASYDNSTNDIENSGSQNSQNPQKRRRNADVWSDKLVDALLESVRVQYSSLGQTRKKIDWILVQEEIVQKYPDAHMLTVGQCYKKWHNLLRFANPYCRTKRSKKLAKAMMSVVGVHNIRHKKKRSGASDGENANYTESGASSMNANHFEVCPPHSIFASNSYSLMNGFNSGSVHSENSVVPHVTKMLQMLQRRQITSNKFRSKILKIESAKMMLLKRFVTLQQKHNEKQNRLLLKLIRTLTKDS